MVVFVILSGLLALGALAAAVAAVRRTTGKELSPRGPAGRDQEGGGRGVRFDDERTASAAPHTALRPVPGSARVRGTMQPLHAEAFSDVIVLDGYVMLEKADQMPTSPQGLATFALCTSPSTSVRAGSAHRRLQEWIDAGTVVDVEVRHHGSRVELDVRDHTSTMQFDVASAR